MDNPFNTKSKYWRISGGEDFGGLIVRANRNLDSPEAPQRLSCGAIVVQKDLRVDRLQYQRLEGLPGEGPLSDGCQSGLRKKR